MSKKLKFSVALLALLSTGNTTIAKNFNSMKILNPPTFENLDINNDGKISKKEIEKQRDFMVQSMDLNGDKMVSTQELIKRHAKRADFFAKRMIKKLDSNGDGSLSFSELKKSQQWKLERMFYRLDKNNDGFISKEEAQTARKNMLKR
jgi:Ca2+-binding EF-hand superfamily protein|tara:strand:- start:84 stop:527 length:444 start_codon:yes stop_codon:yes gene_type:complete